MYRIEEHIAGLALLFKQGFYLRPRMLEGIGIRRVNGQVFKGVPGVLLAKKLFYFYIQNG